MDQAQVEAKTFDLLRQNEVLAIPKRIEVSSKLNSYGLYILIFSFF